MERRAKRSSGSQIEKRRGDLRRAAGKRARRARKAGREEKSRGEKSIAGSRRKERILEKT
jgi:hypothetical protein